MGEDAALGREGTPSIMINGYQQYQKSNVTLASPEMLVVLLYTELLCCIAAAKEALLRDDKHTKNRHTAKAIRILTELMISLNMEKGEEVALNLVALYIHISKRLLQTRIDSTTEPFDEAIKLLTPLKDAWETIARPSAMPPLTTPGLSSVPV